MKPLRKAGKQPFSITKLRLPQMVSFVGERTTGHVGRDLWGSREPKRCMVLKVLAERKVRLHPLKTGKVPEASVKRPPPSMAW